MCSQNTLRHSDGYTKRVAIPGLTKQVISADYNHAGGFPFNYLACVTSYGKTLDQQITRLHLNIQAMWHNQKIVNIVLQSKGSPGINTGV
jgi:hypothetical protein